MNKIKLILSYLVAAIFLVSCTDTEEKSYIDYHKEINVIEFLIQAHNYRDALGVYERLEKSYPHFFSKDLHNACVCAVLSKKYKKAEKYALQLVNHGYELKDFDIPAFSEFKKQKEWKSFLSKYDEQRENYVQSLNNEARKAFANLCVEDQKIASDQPLDIKAQDAGFVHLEKDMLNLINQYGFPPYLIDKDTLKDQLHAMFRHICGMRNANKDIEHPIQEILFKALENGYVSPDQYSSFVSHRGQNYYGEPSISVDFKKRSVKMNQLDNINEINKKRESIGLFPLDTVIISNYLMNSWYDKIPFEKILQKKEEVEQADSLQIDFVKYVSAELEKVKLQYEKENGETDYFILPKPDEAIKVYYDF